VLLDHLRSPDEHIRRRRARPPRSAPHRPMEPTSRSPDLRTRRRVESRHRSCTSDTRESRVALLAWSAPRCIGSRLMPSRSQRPRRPTARALHRIGRHSARDHHHVNSVHVWVGSGDACPRCLGPVRSLHVIGQGPEVGKDKAALSALVRTSMPGRDVAGQGFLGLKLLAACPADMHRLAGRARLLHECSLLRGRL
jgi:hypothetical protein